MLYLPKFDGIVETKQGVLSFNWNILLLASILIVLDAVYK